MNRNVPAEPPEHLIPVEEQSPKNRILALTLGCFGGIFGLHRFYTGRFWSGLAMMLTLGGFLMWWIVDFFVLLTGRFKDSQGRVLGRPLVMRPEEIEKLPPEARKKIPDLDEKLARIGQDRDESEEDDLLADPLEKKFEELEEEAIDTEPAGVDGRV